MATLPAADDRFDATSRSQQHGPISWELFNLALFGFHAVMGLMNFVVAGKAAGVPWAGLFLTTALDLARYAAFLLVTAWFVMVFWRRFLTSVVAVRSIGYQEAIAIVLMIGILFGS